MPSDHPSPITTQIQSIIQASAIYVTTGGVNAHTWRSGDRFIVNKLGALNTEFSNEATSNSRSIMILEDFASPDVISAFISQLTHWLSLRRRIGIVIPTTLLSNHSHVFHRAIAHAFITSMCESPYSIAYRAFDMVTGAQSITEVEKTATGELVYKSSIQGPVDCFPFALLRSIPSVRVIQLTSPINPSAFFTAPEYHTSVINNLSYRLLSDHATLRNFHELWISPKVLFFKHNSTALCVTDTLAVWADDVKIGRLVLTGHIDEAHVHRNAKHLQRAFPYLEGPVEYYSAFA